MKWCPASAPPCHFLPMISNQELGGKGEADCGNKSGLNSIRIRPELRAAQVKRSQSMVPAFTLYFDKKYDLGGTAIPDSFMQVSLIRCIRFLTFSNAQILEVPEPLWLRFAPRNLLLLLVWRVSGLVKRQPKISVTYTIENNNFAHLLAPNVALPSAAVKICQFLAGTAISLFIDRIAFGSAYSRDLYQSLKGVSGIPSKLIEELPAASNSCTNSLSNSSRQRAVFIGEMDDRKGVQDLMLSWPYVETALPDAVLRIVGHGKYAADVQRWCEERGDRRVFTGLIPHDETTSILSDSDVLVAPSRRSGRWREQIGLPIVEALALGLTVVTTDETGLASWLHTNGHIVVPETAVERDLGDAIKMALECPLAREVVLEALPSIPGRIAADTWLHQPLVPSSTKDEIQ